MAVQQQQPGPLRRRRASDWVEGQRQAVRAGQLRARPGAGRTRGGAAPGRGQWRPHADRALCTWRGQYERGSFSGGYPECTDTYSSSCLFVDWPVPKLRIYYDGYPRPTGDWVGSLVQDQRDSTGLLDLGKTAFTPNRLQHASRHLMDAGLLPNWSKRTGELFTEMGSKILENPLATFDHKLGGTAVKGFHGKVDGTDVVFFVFKEGKYQGEVATSVVPTSQQMRNWGLR